MRRKTYEDAQGSMVGSSALKVDSLLSLECQAVSEGLDDVTKGTQ